MTIIRLEHEQDCDIFQGASCAFGVFDGLHRGHQYIIESALDTAKEAGAANASASTATETKRALVLTFDIDPDEIFHPQRLEKLMSNSERLANLESSGVDAVVVMPFVPALYTLSPRDFLETTFGKASPAHLHVGENLRFGARAQGAVADLREWGERAACEIHAHPLLQLGNEAISSTRIRTLFRKGEVEEAEKLLGHPLQPTFLRPGAQS